MWQCPKCPMSFTCRGLWMQHYKRHHPVTQHILVLEQPHKHEQEHEQEPNVQLNNNNGVINIYGNLNINK